MNIDFLTPGLFAFKLYHSEIIFICRRNSVIFPIIIDTQVHKKKTFGDIKYQTQIRRLGADDLPQTETRLARHLHSKGVKTSLIYDEGLPRSPAHSQVVDPTSYTNDNLVGFTFIALNSESVAMMKIEHSRL